MLRTILGWIGIALAGAGYLPAAGFESSSPAPPPASLHRAVLHRYCVTCHNEKLRVAGLALSALDLEKVGEGAAVWEKVVRKLRTRAMPPAGMPRPDQAAYDSFATYLETELDGAAAAKPNPGRPVIRRLNRAEYSNAIRDLLGLDTDALDIRSLLPADESKQGFDNSADALTVSPLLLERYLAAARKITRLAMGDRTIRPVFETYDLPKYLMQQDRMSEDLPFGTRGGIAIHHYFPLDAEYVVRVRLQRDARDYVRGLGEPHQLDVSLDGESLKRFTVGGEHKGRSAGIFSSAAQGDPEQEEYERITADAGLEVRFPAQAGTRLVAVAFLKDAPVPEGPLQPRLTQIDFASYKGGKPAVGSVTISGPYNVKGIGDTPSRRKIFVCRPNGAKDEEPCARKILSTLARRAYRRAITDEDVATLLRFYKSGRSQGDFEAGIGTALERILLGPEFLFRMERDSANVAPGTAYRISDLELATRLSFFLWSSIPDDELLDWAARGQLKNPEALEQQVRRMLRDSRAKALASNFAGQWLYLRNLRSVNPDPEAFPYFDEELRDAFRQETELFFESIAREDRSVIDLLNADYTFVNERLARHYQIANIYGSHFRRVTLSDEARRGLLGQGSILTVTSYANRTSPVLRGKWVLDNILGTPPPPPPANVPSLKERGDNGQALSVRERMEKHRANPACASCHKLMDPLGFALENFDGNGWWRTTDGNTPIDPSGALPDGAKFQGPAGLRRLLLGKREQFVTTVTEKLLTYALGRGVASYDAPAVRKILRESAPGDYRWSSLILGIVRSTPFQMRRSREP